MNSDNVNLFLQAFQNTLQKFGVTNINRCDIKKKGNFYVDSEVSAFVSLNGVVQGIIALSMSQDTAKNLVSMMMGMKISVIDETVKSAVGELVSIIAGTSSTLAASSGLVFRISSPTVLFGSSNINSVEAIAIYFDTQLGKIEFNIGLN
jgi:chemotaxis protein CheX